MKHRCYGVNCLLLILFSCKEYLDFVFFSQVICFVSPGYLCFCHPSSDSPVMPPIELVQAVFMENHNSNA